MKKTTQVLHQKILALVKQERSLLTQILQHLTEINQAKLFLEFGHDSLLKYCVKELGYSESAAFRRIKALRLTQTIPEVAQAIENGSLNLSQVALAQSLFERKSQDNGRTVEKEEKVQILQSLSGLNHHASETQLRQHLQLPHKKKRLMIELEEDTFERWVRLKGQMVHKNWSEEKLLGYLLELAEEKRLHTAAPMRRKILLKESSRQRHIPAWLKRELLRQTKHCQYPNCQSTYALEIDHIRPVAQGGTSGRNNLQILCRHHNQYRALNLA